jgi:hypothetical protein
MAQLPIDSALFGYVVNFAGRELTDDELYLAREAFERGRRDEAFFEAALTRVIQQREAKRPHSCGSARYGVPRCSTS